MGIPPTMSQEIEEEFYESLTEGGVCLINNLPPELLSHIFEIGTEAQDEGDTDDSCAEIDLSALESPGPFLPFQILVSNVCRHWRNVALSTPSLWTVIGVTPAAGLSLEPGLTLLERSKDLPIDICINCHVDVFDDAQAPSDNDTKSLFSIFFPHVHRWRTIVLGVPKYHLMYDFLSAISDPSIAMASKLTTLELYYNREAEEPDSFGHPNMSKHLTLFGGSAPLLTTLALWGVHVDWDQSWIASASNLTDLELAFHTEDVRPSWTQFVAILRGAPALERLTLQQSGPSGDPANWFIEPTPGCPADLNGPVQLLRLKDFTIASCSQARAIGLLQKFYLPTLKDLSLDFDDGDFTEFVLELAGPATSLSPAQEQRPSLLNGLESLKIVGLPCRVECIETLYGELQNTTSLNISLPCLPPLFLDILSAPCTLAGRSNVWLPQLATLHVSSPSAHYLRQVVRKRKDMGVPLSSLHVESLCEMNNKDTEWLRDNVKTVKFSRILD